MSAIAHYRLKPASLEGRWDFFININSGEHLDPADIGTTAMFDTSPRRIEHEISALRQLGYELVCDSPTTFEMVEDT